MVFEPEAIERSERLARENIASGKIPFRRSCIWSAVDRGGFDGAVIRILGGKATLEQPIAGRATASACVGGFEPNWRATLDKSANTYVVEIPI